MNIDEDQHLILYWNDDRSFKDVTGDIEKIMPAGNGFSVTHKNSPKIYTFGPSRLQILQEPTERKIFDELVFVEERLVPDVQKILIFQEFSRIFTKKERRVANSAAITYERNCLCDPEIKNPLGYFTEISSIGLTP